MKLFTYRNYRAYLTNFFTENNEDTAGDRTLKAAASRLRVHPSLLSRVLKGERQLTPEQAFAMAAFIRLDELGTSYFLSLVELDRSGSSEHRRHIERQLDRIRNEALSVSADDPENHPLSTNEQMVYYSAWYYAAIRLLTSMPLFQSTDPSVPISEHLRMPRDIVDGVIDFLITTGLCNREEDGRVVRSSKDTNLGKDSRQIDRHLMNWRAKALERLPLSTPENLFNSSVIVVSSESADKLKAAIKSLIAETIQAPKAGDPVKLQCLNIDWFEV